MEKIDNCVTFNNVSRKSQMFLFCEACPDLSGAHFLQMLRFQFVGNFLAKNSGNGGRMKATKLK